MRKMSAFIFIFMLSTLIVNSEINPDTITIRLGTPRDAIVLHYRYLEPDSYFPQKSAKALDIDNMKTEKVEELALKLKKIMNAKAFIVRITEIPNDSNYIDAASGKHIYYPLKNNKDIYLEKTGTKWKYSRKTVHSIYEIYHQLYPIDLRAYVDEINPIMKARIFGNAELWQILGLMLLLAAGYLIKRILTFITEYILRFLFGKSRFSTFSERFLIPNLKTLFAIVSLYIIYEYLAPLELPLKLIVLLDFLFKAFIPLLFTIIAFRLTDFFAESLQKRMHDKGNKMHENFLPFLRTSFKVLIIIIGLLAMLINLGVDIIPLLAGVSIGGIAIALAAQETIKNIFGSLTIFADRPFDVGDWIIYEGNQGVVESIGLRSSTLRTFDNSLITVPNGKLMDLTIDNMGKRAYRRFETNIGVLYDTPTELLDRFMKAIKRIILDHTNTRKDQCFVYFSEFAPSALQIYIRFWVVTDEYETELKTRHEILMDILRLGRELRIGFAYPTQTLNIEKFPGADESQHDYPKTSEEINEKIDKFFGD